MLIAQYSRYSLYMDELHLVISISIVTASWCLSPQDSWRRLQRIEDAGQGLVVVLDL